MCRMDWRFVFCFFSPQARGLLEDACAFDFKVSCGGCEGDLVFSGPEEGVREGLWQSAGQEFEKLIELQS